MQTQAPEKKKLLIVDDEDFAPARLKEILGTELDITVGKAASDAMRLLQRERFDAVVLDINLPDIPGTQLLKIIRDRYPEVPVVMLTGYSDYRLAIDSMLAGAAEYVVKSVDNFDEEMRMRLGLAMRNYDLIKQNAGLTAKLAEHTAKYEIIGHSAATLKLRSEIIAVRPTQATALITGESGVGKELIARALNNQDPNKARPFVAVNCGSLPETLIESELFGHEKGAFTHAIQARKGKFLAANGGDIFLDEIGEMPLNMQTRLLRVLEERVVTPVGSDKSIPINVRVIAGTNKDLGAEVRAGRFREDLFYRLAVVQLEVPPLRERIEDIPVLAQHFLKGFGAEHMALSKAARSLLGQHSWPGNIRALKNSIEGAIIKARADGQAVIEPEMIRLHDVAYGRVDQTVEPMPYLPLSKDDLTPELYREHMDWAEKEFLEAGYKAVGHSKTTLANQLKLDRTTIHKKFRLFGIDQPKTSARSSQAQGAPCSEWK